MSAYWGYQCISHDPPLTSEHWFNHGEETLRTLFAKMRAGTWPIDDILGPVPVSNGNSGHSTNSPPVWLMEHPKCEVVLHNEYGDTAPIVRPLVPGERGDTRIPIWGADRNVWNRLLKKPPYAYTYSSWPGAKTYHRPRPYTGKDGTVRITPACQGFTAARGILTDTKPAHLRPCKACIKEPTR